ncbi:MAG: hypothetical protein IT357_07210 [Gemmatimonadaceae bacterium]|nr:hypothetical protein [Gemmatimonadaceae bacterium]
MTDPTCPTCRVTMEVGFVVDHAHANSPTVAKWTAGTPEKSFWYGIKLRGKERLSIVTYRCPKCAVLHSYAPMT